MSQCARIFFEDVAVPLNLDEQFYQQVHRKLARECVIDPLPAGSSVSQRIQLFLDGSHDERAGAYGRVDDYVKIRISMVELLFRNVMTVLSFKRLLFESRKAGREKALAKYGFREPNVEAIMDQSHFEGMERAVNNAIIELNARFRIGGMPLHYHNGLIQIATDEKVEEQIVASFWSITSDPKWANVDLDMKEAVNRMNTGGKDPVLYATMALESTIKIISGEKGWTRGKESGAHAFIDNLVSEANGRFIAVWEAEALKAIFTRLRNPHGHGPGSEPQPNLTAQQTEWAIETCMSWIKSLVRR